MFHKQHHATDFWEGTLLIEYPLLARRYILQECVKFVQRNLRGLLEKENEKRPCGGVLIVKCHSACLQIVAHKAKLFVNMSNVF